MVAWEHTATPRQGAMQQGRTLDSGYPGFGLDRQLWPGLCQGRGRHSQASEWGEKMGLGQVKM